MLLHVVSSDGEGAAWEGFPAALMPLFDGLAVTQLLRRGAVGREILAAAREEGADLILLTRHGRWQGGVVAFSRFLLHSVLCRILLDAACPVWIEPEAGAPPDISRILCGVVSLVHDRDTIGRAGSLAAVLGARLTLFRSAIRAAFAIPGQSQQSKSMQQEVITAVAADLEALRGELAVPADIRIGVGRFAAALLEDAGSAPAELVAVRRTSREWGRDETLHALVRDAAIPVVIFPSSPPPLTARSPVRARRPRLARWMAAAMLLMIVLSGVWIMYRTFQPLHGTDCKAHPDLCPVLNGYLRTAKERASAGK